MWTLVLEPLSSVTVVGEKILVGSFSVELKVGQLLI